MCGTRLEVAIVPSNREGAGGRHDRNYDSIDDRYQPEILDDPTLYPSGSPPNLPAPTEADLSTLDQLERVAYSAGLWGEGILKGTILVMPAILLLAMAVGLTMGIIRVGVRGTEKFFPVRRRCD